MNEILVIFSLAATGCLVGLSMDLAMQFFARRVPRGRTVAGPGHGQAPETQSKVEPLVTLGATLACYGAIAAALVSELPGLLAVQRTGLAFALSCVGGLIGEISRTGSGTDKSDANSDEEANSDEGGARERTPSSVGLSVALMLVLNLAIAVLVSGQGLVQVVPPRAPVIDNQSTELEQIVVVARRGTEDLSGSTFL